MTGSTTTTKRAKAVALALATALLAAWAISTASLTSDQSVNSGTNGTTTSVVHAGKWPVTKGKKW